MAATTANDMRIGFPLIKSAFEVFIEKWRCQRICRVFCTIGIIVD
jgi:hypothetical protein